MAVLFISVKKGDTFTHRILYSGENERTTATFNRVSLSIIILNENKKALEDCIQYIFLIQNIKQN